MHVSTQARRLRSFNEALCFIEIERSRGRRLEKRKFDDEGWGTTDGGKLRAKQSSNSSTFGHNKWHHSASPSTL